VNATQRHASPKAANTSETDVIKETGAKQEAATAIPSAAVAAGLAPERAADASQVAATPLDAALSLIDLGHFFGVDLQILAVTPNLPMENSPIKITFQLRNLFDRRTLNGLVRFTGSPAFPDPLFQPITNLLPGQTQRGYVWGLAPLAGQGVSIDVVYEESTAPPFNVTAETEIDIRAQYQLSVDWLKVLNPRSLDDDTLIGTCCAHYGDAVLQPAVPARPFEFVECQQAVYGDHGSGDVVLTGFLFETFEGVPGVAPDLVFNYYFCNAGGTDTDEQKARQWLEVLSKIGAAVATFELPSYAAIWSLVDYLLDIGLSEIFQSCDGLVAGDQFKLTSAQLDQVTRSGGGFGLVNTYTGTPSPWNCGEVSHYQVHWLIMRLSNQPAII
jgi:hypothetical protein